MNQRCRFRRPLPALAGVLALLVSSSGASFARSVAAPAVKAAFLYNFAKFAEWPALLSGARLVVCIVGDDEVAGALVETVRGQNISGHTLDIWRTQDSATWG